MIIKYIKSILRIMPLFICSLSCSFDPKEGVVIVEDKTVRLETAKNTGDHNKTDEDKYYLVHNVQGRTIKLLIDEAFIDWQSLKQCYPDSKDDKKALLQYFINDFHDPELKLKVKYIAAEVGHGFAITLCAREQIKDEDGNRVLCNNYVSRYISGEPLVNQYGKECYGALVFTKYIEAHKIDLIGYVMCLLDERKPGAIKELCEHYRDLMQEHPTDEEQQNNWRDIVQDIIDTIGVKLNLTVEQFIAQNPIFCAEDMPLVIDALQTFPGLTLRAVFNDIRKPVVAMLRDTKHKGQCFTRRCDLNSLVFEQDQQIDDAIKNNTIKLTEYVKQHQLKRAHETLLTEDVYKTSLENDQHLTDDVALRYKLLYFYPKERINNIVYFHNTIRDNLLRDIVQRRFRGCRRRLMRGTIINHIDSQFKLDICPELSSYLDECKIDDYAFTIALAAYIYSTYTNEWVKYADDSTNPFYLDNE